MEFYFKHKKYINLITLLISIFLLFLAIDSFPLISDDLIYCNKWGSSEKLSSLEDVIYYQQMHYIHWGGRTVAHTILQLLFLIGKPFSSILTTFVIVLLGVLVSKYSSKDFKLSIENIILFLGLIYFINQTFEENILWMTGAANYLWTTCIIFLAMYPYIKYIKGLKLSVFDYLFVLFAFFAGWCNENTSAVFVFFMFCFGIYTLYKYKKIYLWNAISFVLGLIGFGLMILAPGNFARTSVLPHGIMSLMYRGHGQVNAWFNWLFLGLLIFIILNYYSKDKKEPIKLSYVGMFILSVLIMVASPSYPSRACFGSLVFLLVPILMEFNNLKNDHSKLFNLIVILVGTAFIMNMFSISLLQIVRTSGVYIPG